MKAIPEVLRSNKTQWQAESRRKKTELASALTVHTWRTPSEIEGAIRRENEGLRRQLSAAIEAAPVDAQTYSHFFLEARS